MLSLGDVHIYVSDFEAALDFWANGLGLSVVEKEVTPHAAYALLEFPDGGAVRLFAPVDPWDPESQPPPGTYPSVRFDIMTDDFDAALVRLLEHSGRQLDEVETYENLRMVSIGDPDGNSFELLEVPAPGADA
jgi:catechol 2,3-dioxygenase-like lactoylglutathione lyase family enzyme